MGVIIYINGEGSISGTKNLSKKETLELNSIKNVWKQNAFSFDENNFEFSRDQMEGLLPYEEGVVLPLKKLVSFAKEHKLAVNGEFTVTSSVVDYERIRIVIEKNQLYITQR